MVAQKIYRSLVVYIYACLLAVIVSGCAGGGSGDQDGTSSSVAGSYVDIAAIPGPIVAAEVGAVVVLEDRKSYAKSRGALSYNWSFANKPAGSHATLQGATSATPSFVADVAGVYMLQLVVSADGVSSQRAVTSVIVNNDIKPTGRFNHQGLSSNCVNCHNYDFSKIPSKGPVHIGASNACQACHTPQGFNIIPVVDHQEVFGDCSQCHDGITAIGKSEFHQPTEAECDDCHNTIAFLELNPDGSFDHSNIGRVCSGCHNGTIAIGKTPTKIHNETNSECIYCHTVDSFLGAYPDHTDPAIVGSGCDSCHGVSQNDQASDPPPGHPLTSLDCGTCHSIVSFKMPGGIFNHSLVDPAVQPCESCHNDNTSINAPGLTPNHRATNGQDCGVCHNTVSFADAIFDHTGIVSDCGLTCHVADGSGTASGMPLSTPFYAHMPTSEDCSVCHTPGSFSTGNYDHAGEVSGCNACHNDVISVGKLPNHIPTSPDNQDCADCHNTTAFADATFNHVGITSNCSQCHDGVISAGKTANHLPTNQDCSYCHVTTTIGSSAIPFRDTLNFNHTGINSDCESCHNGNRNYVAVGATGKIPDHIPAANVCADCHSSTTTGGFATSTFMSNVHPGIAGGCEGCHSGQFSTTSDRLYGKPGNHLPTVQDCDACHNNVDFADSIFSHAGITGNCESCHDGSWESVMGPLGIGALGKTPIHPATSADCGSCHAIGNNFTDGTFDHTGIVNNCSACHGDNPTDTPVGPKKNIGHVQTTQDCSVCHVPGTFTTAVFSHAGIVDNCASCHDGSAAVGTVKPGNHPPTTQDCSLCHNTTAFAGARFDHTGIVDNCASCHNGTTAPGKTPPPDHVPTSDDCHVCHVTTGFIPGIFDHAGIVDNCRSCHNDVFAVGKSDTHVLTNQDCGVCHNTTTFIGAVFDHTGIVDNCSSCHGVTATGMSNDHISTSLDCHFCHTTATFVGGSWFHDSSTAGRCDDCHSPGGGATFKPNDHINTAEQCDVCHTTNGWAPDIFRHSSQGNYPGDHRRNPGCTGCHKGSIGSGINSDNYPNQLRYAPFCAGCHANDFESKSDHIGGRSGTIEQNKDCSGGGRGCHKVSDSNFD